MTSRSDRRRAKADRNAEPPEPTTAELEAALEAAKTATHQARGLALWAGFELDKHFDKHKCSEEHFALEPINWHHKQLPSCEERSRLATRLGGRVYDWKKARDAWRSAAASLVQREMRNHVYSCEACVWPNACPEGGPFFARLGRAGDIGLCRVLDELV